MLEHHPAQNQSAPIEEPAPMTLEHMLPHPFAEAFPLLPKDEAEALAADIKANGLVDPITTFEGKILDGRNRYNACIAAGVEPRFVEFIGTPAEALAFVISRNLIRRHLNDSQRAMAAARLANMPLGGASYRSANLPTDGGTETNSANLPNCPLVSQADAASQLKVSTRSVTTAKKVLKSGDEKLIKSIDDGELSVSAAASTLKASQFTKANATRKARAKQAATSVDTPAKVDELLNELRDLLTRAALHQANVERIYEIEDENDVFHDDPNDNEFIKEADAEWEKGFDLKTQSLDVMVKLASLVTDGTEEPSRDWVLSMMMAIRGRAEKLLKDAGLR